MQIKWTKRIDGEKQHREDLESPSKMICGEFF